MKSESKIVTGERKYNGEKGASSIEYVVLAAMIIAVLVVTISLLGDNTRGLFETTRDAIDDNFPR